MKLFQNQYEDALDRVIKGIEMDMNNNYKDAAQDSLKVLEAKFMQFKEEGKLGKRAVKKYQQVLDGYKQKLKGYSHKDQKPFWS